MVSHEAWVQEVEQMYGWVAYFREPLSLRMMRRVLLFRPVGAVCRTVVTVISAVEGLDHG
jgi:hypothetical protein